MTTSRIRRIARAAVASTAALAAFATVTWGSAPTASAMSPKQTIYSGVVNLLGGTQTGSIANFWSTTMRSWGKAYVKPNLWYYNTSTVGLPASSCSIDWNNSYYCRPDNGIYLDYAWNQYQLNRYGDYGAGGILAHEWGHAIQAWLGQGSYGYRSEYSADCLAGMYTHYGYAIGRLTGSDYGEMYNWLYYRGYDSTHGRGTARAAWYEYGYTQYNLAACNQAYNLPATPAKSAPAATKRQTETASVKRGYKGELQAPPAPPVQVKVVTGDSKVGSVPLPKLHGKNLSRLPLVMLRHS